jgi:T4 RnlA family RNA ligase
MKLNFTYEQAREFVDINGEVAFYESVFYIDGFKISLFNYRITTYDDFRKGNQAEEMRGITFVFNKDGSLYKRYLMLPKIFNINQIEETEYDTVKSYEIESILAKEDGTLINFIQLPNGRILPRTKMSFENDQTNMALSIYDADEELQRLVKWSLENDICLFFEYVSFDNKIVLHYNKSKLIFINARHNITGEFIDINTIETSIEKAIDYSKVYTLDELVHFCAVEENVEGFIIRCTNGFSWKMKTKWYFDIHDMQDALYQEYKVIQFALNDEIDDVLSQIPLETVDLRERVKAITKIVNDEIEIYSDKIDKELETYTDPVTLIEKLENIDKVLMHLVLNIKNGNDKFTNIKKRIHVETKKHIIAQKWLFERGYKLL